MRKAFPVDWGIDVVARDDGFVARESRRAGGDRLTGLAGVGRSGRSYALLADGTT